MSEFSLLRKKPERGFTLIEMFIVIAVIGILAGVVLRGTAGFQASARDTRRIGDLKNAQNYLELYFNKCGHYPGNADCTVATQTINTPSGWINFSNLLVSAGVLSNTSNFPKDPVPSKSYFYGVDSADNLQYVIGALLEKPNRVMIDDIDGTVFGIDCGIPSNDTIYCIQS